jgi:hypothetical protein
MKYGNRIPERLFPVLPIAKKINKKNVTVNTHIFLFGLSMFCLIQGINNVVKINTY